MIVFKSFSTLFLFALVMSGVLVIICASSKTEDAGSRNAAIAGNHPAAVPDPGDVEDSDEKESSEQAALDAALELTETSQEYLASGDEEKAIEALDEAYALTIRVNPGNDLKLVRQKEEIRFAIYRIILELNSVRNVPGNGGQKAIPITVNKYV
jgi:hypothetical protein